MATRSPDCTRSIASISMRIAFAVFFQFVSRFAESPLIDMRPMPFAFNCCKFAGQNSRRPFAPSPSLIEHSAASTTCGK